MKSVTLSDNQIERFLSVTDNLKHEEPHQYERVRIKDGKVVFILYNSKKLVYNENKRNLKILELILEDEYDDDYYDDIEDYDYDFITHTNYEHLKQKYLDKYEKNLLNYRFTIGSDETGKGEWYGPLVVTATCISSDEIFELKCLGVTDSKELERNEILKLYEKIEKLGIKHETIILKPHEYNKIYKQYRQSGKNLNHLLADLHSKAITTLLEQLDTTDVLVIIDRFDEKKMNRALNINSDIKVIQENNGERYLPVATSSIIAKYHFEKTLKEIEEKYNISLRETIPYKIDRKLLEKTCKTHFKNVNRFMK